MSINVCVLHNGKAYVASDAATSKESADNSIKFKEDNKELKLKRFGMNNDFIVVVSGNLFTIEENSGNSKTNKSIRLNNGDITQRIIDVVIDYFKHKADTNSTLLDNAQGFVKTHEKDIENNTFIRVVGKCPNDNIYKIVKIEKFLYQASASPCTKDIFGSGEGWEQIDNLIGENSLTLKDVCEGCNIVHCDEQDTHTKDAEGILKYLLEKSGKPFKDTIITILKFYAEKSGIPADPTNGVSICMEELP